MSANPDPSLAGRAEAPGHPDVWIVTAGVPCQDVSVAGKRAGLAGERTGLFFEFARVLREVRSAWFVFENVPGLLSSNRGRDFAEVLRVLMVECGYGVSWRVLDSRFFGVAQRRRRVFVVGSLGKPCPAEILFEPARGGGNPAPYGEARTDIAVTLTSGVGVTGNAPGRRREDDFNLATTLSAEYSEKAYRGDGSENVVARTITSCIGKGGFTDPVNDNIIAYALRGDPGGIGQGHNTTYAVTGNMRNRSQGPGSYVCNSLSPVRGGPDNNDAQSNHLVPDVSPQERTLQQRGDSRGNDGHDGNAHDVRAAVDADRMRDFAGLPEGLDSPRYRGLGNAVTVQVVEWIIRRIIAWEEKVKPGLYR